MNPQKKRLLSQDLNLVKCGKPKEHSFYTNLVRLTQKPDFVMMAILRKK